MQDIERLLALYKGVVPGMSYKATRRMLLKIIGKDAARHRPTKQFIEQISRGAVEAFNMGKRDGEKGAAKQSEKCHCHHNGDTLTASVLRFANDAYQSGYEVGKMIRMGVSK